MPIADRIFLGGTVITMETSQPRAEAVAVAGGRILAVGALSDVEAFASAKTERVDLKGAILLPGFVEAHSHPMMSALAWGDPVVDVRAVHTPTYDAVLEKMRRRMTKAVPGEVVWFLGLDPQLHAGMEEPPREVLDKLAPDNAVIVQTSNFHGIFLNSKALEFFGIGADYAPPLGGKFIKASDGLPWKLMETAAWALLKRFHDHLGEQRRSRCFEEWVGKFVRAGYTTTSEIMIEPGASPMLQAAVKSRRNPLRIVGYEGVHLGGEVTVPLNFGDDDFRVIGTKLHADGSVLLGNVWSTHPYLNNTMTLKGMGLPENSTGHANISPEKTYELVSKYVREGWQMSVHSHGDRTIDMVLDAYEKVISETPNISGPLRLEHCGMMREDQIDRAIRLGVVCSYFLPYIYNWGEALRDYLLGEEAAARFVPSGSAIRKGMRASFHCDSPMTWPDALVCLHVAVTRRTMKGAVIGPEQRIDVETALKAITIDAAYQLQMEDRIGSISPGKYADFVILSQNPTTCDPERLLEISILGTVIGGEHTASFYELPQ